MGSKLTNAKAYIAALRWIHHALQSDGSLFTPGKEIWSGELLTQVRRKLENNPDRRRSFILEILRQQLAGSSPDVYQLTAEALYIYCILPNNMTYTSKTGTINQVLEWAGQPEIPDNLSGLLSPGIARFDYSRDLIRVSVSFLIEFTKQWKEQTAIDRDEMLKNPWAFKDFAKRFNPNQEREALLHLVHPDTFEAIVDVAVKEKIAAAFPDAVKDPTDDIDYKLQQIRANLEKQIGAHDHLFGKPVIRSHWDYCIKRVSNCL